MRNFRQRHLLVGARNDEFALGKFDVRGIGFHEMGCEFLALFNHVVGGGLQGAAPDHH